MDNLKTIKNLCRVCLCEPEDLAEGDQMVFLNSAQIQKLICIGDSVEIVRVDEQPLCLCEECEAQLDFVFDFITKFNASKITIKKYMDQFIQKEETSPNDSYPDDPYQVADLNLEAVDITEDFGDNLVTEQFIEIVKMESSPPQSPSPTESTFRIVNEQQFEPPNYHFEMKVEPKPKPKIGPKSKMKERLKLERKLASVKSKRANEPSSTPASNTKLMSDRTEIKLELQSKSKKELKSTNNGNSSTSPPVTSGHFDIKTELELEPMATAKNNSKSKKSNGRRRRGSFSSDNADNVCYICQNTFSTRANMLRHVREHLGRRFSCDYPNCNAFFTQKSSLQVHIAKHQGHKPHACTICGKRFSQSKSLVFHVRVHTGESPYECEYCEKKFKQKSNLIRHFKSHRKPLPLQRKRFECERCSKYLASKQSLIRHLERHERIDQEQTLTEAIKIEKNILG